MGRFRRAVTALVVLWVGGGCADGPAAEAGPEPFPGSAPSLELLGRQVLEALTRADTITLRGFRLTEEEHNLVVWPELPASAPEVNYPVDFAWSNIERRDQRALSRLLPVFSGRAPSFRRVACEGGVQEFQTFRVHVDCWIRFESSGEGGTALEVQAFKDVLERAGGFKVFRYYDEPPRPVHADGGR